MKKLFIALSFSLPLLFVACEPQEETTDKKSNNDGFWDVECTSVYDSIPTTTCDSVWVNDTTNGTWEVQCDSVLTYDSLQNSYYSVDCKQVWVSGNTQGGHYESTNCVTTYDVKLVETCDSTWIPDNSNQADSTQIDSSGYNNNNNNNGSWKWQCDSVYQGNNFSVQCDSVLVAN